MKKYDSYKDSGIEWIGKVPDHWDVSSIKFLAKIQNGSTPSSSVEEFWSGEVNWVTTDDLGKLKGKVITKTKRTITQLGYESCGTSLAPIGSIVLSTRAPIGHIGILNIEACSNQGCKTIIPIKINSNFCYFYFLKSKEILESLGQGSTFKELPTPTLKDFKVAFPNIEEQTEIANYLDHKTNQIDTLISKKLQFINLLQEERIAVINQAVTKGLDPNVPMKDSGIDWLGEIPEHWETYRIDWITNIVRGNTGFKKDELLDNGEYVALQYGKTYKVDIVDDSFNYFVNSEFYKENQIVSKGDTILISTSETIEDLGHVCYYDNENVGLLGGEQILLKPNRKVLYEKYLYQYARQFCLELKKYATGLKVFRFSTHDLKQIFLAIPSIQEQIQIADFLDSEIFRIESLTIKMKKEIELLKEYKTALISEVVTGKVDVRNAKLN